MPDERLTRKQKRDVAREAAREIAARRRKRERLNKLLLRIGVTAVVLGLLAGIGGIAWINTRPEAPGPSNMLSGGALFTGGGGDVQIVETAGMPAKTEAVPNPDSAYTAPIRISTYIDFTCEFCKEFEVGNGTTTGNGALIKDLVSSGKATLEVFPVAILGSYSEVAGSAAACVAQYQPTSYFDMLKVMFEQQPDVENGAAPYTTAQILDLWRSVGIEPSSDLTSCVTDERYVTWMKARTASVTADPALVNPTTGSFATPTVMVNGVRYTPTTAGQLGDPTAFQAFIDSTVASGSGSGSTSTPTPTPTP